MLTIILTEIILPSTAEPLAEHPTKEIIPWILKLSPIFMNTLNMGVGECSSFLLGLVSGSEVLGENSAVPE